jgi:hypothetical protein
MILLDDSDPAMVPHGDPIANRTISALAGQLTERGYAVIDGLAAGFAPATPRKRRTDGELIDLAKEQRTPIDAIVVVQIFASVRKNLDDMLPDIRIPARVITSRGRLLMEFEGNGEPSLPALPGGCDRECMLQKVGDGARIVARATANALASKLDSYLHPATEPTPLPKRPRTRRH